MAGWAGPVVRVDPPDAVTRDRSPPIPPLQLAVIKRQLNDGLNRSMAEAIESKASRAGVDVLVARHRAGAARVPREARAPMHRR